MIDFLCFLFSVHVTKKYSFLNKKWDWKQLIRERTLRMLPVILFDWAQDVSFLIQSEDFKSRIKNHISWKQQTMAFGRIKEREPSPWFIKLELISLLSLRFFVYACASVTSYMNNKSKVIHEIEILLIVGNELLKNFQRLRFSQLHNVLNCTFLFLILPQALHCFSFTKPVLFPFFMALKA